MPEERRCILTTAPSSASASEPDEMAIPLLGNYARTTNASTMTAGASSATLASTAGFVVPGNNQYGIVRVDDVNAGGYDPNIGPFEIIYFTTNAANVLGGFTTPPGGRGQEGTAAHAFAAGAVWQQDLTKGALQLMPMKFDEQTPSAVSSVRIPASGSLPASGYRHLEIQVIGRSSAAVSSDEFGIQFSGITGAVYAVQRISANGSSTI